MFVTAFVPLNVDILSHELFKSQHRTWRTKSLSCLFGNIFLQGKSLKPNASACPNPTMMVFKWFFRRLFNWQSQIILLLYHLKYHRRICVQYWKQILLWHFWWCDRKMIIVCQLKWHLKNYLETLIVGFGQADGRWTENYY